MLEAVLHEWAGNLTFMPSPSDYAQRLRLAMESRDPPAKVGELATACDVSYQAVSQLLRGESKEFKVDAHFKAAAALKVDATWLATGHGEMRPLPAMRVSAAERALLLTFREKLELDRKVPEAGSGDVSTQSDTNVVRLPPEGERRQLAGKEVSGLPGTDQPRRRQTDADKREIKK